MHQEPFTRLERGPLCICRTTSPTATGLLLTGPEMRQNIKCLSSEGEIPATPCAQQQVRSGELRRLLVFQATKAVVRDKSVAILDISCDESVLTAAAAASRTN